MVCWCGVERLRRSSVVMCLVLYTMRYAFAPHGILGTKKEMLVVVVGVYVVVGVCF